MQRNEIAPKFPSVKKKRGGGGLHMYPQMIFDVFCSVISSNVVVGKFVFVNSRTDYLTSINWK